MAESLERCTSAARGARHLTFVVNCNLQRLAGPVRGTARSSGARVRVPRLGWNVIKVIWGREWDDLLAATATASS